MAWLKPEGPFCDGVINVGTADLPSWLIIGSERALLVDANMVYLGDALLANLARHLPAGRRLDGILLTHAHFDHVGGIPRLRRAYPDLVVFGSPAAAQVFGRNGARQLIRDLNREAGGCRGGSLPAPEDDFSSLFVDRPIGDGDVIGLGDDSIVALATPGHTRCSVTYLLSRRRMLFGGETFGIRLRSGTVCPEYLSSYEDYQRSLQRCRAMAAGIVCLPHFGVLTEVEAGTYWHSATVDAEESAAIVASMLRVGYRRSEIVHLLKRKYYVEDLCSHQPERAFEFNAGHSIDLIAGLLSAGLLPAEVERRRGAVAAMLLNRGVGLIAGVDRSSSVDRTRSDTALSVMQRDEAKRRVGIPDRGR